MNTSNKFTPQMLLNALFATLESAVFLKSGPLRYEHTTSGASWSFVVLLVAVPFNLFILSLVQASDPALQLKEYALLSMNYLTAAVYALALVIVTLYGFCASRKKLHLFPQCVCALNWLTLVPMALLALPLFLVGTGYHTLEDIQIFTLLLSFYVLWVVGFAFLIILQISWVAAGSLTFIIYLIQNMTITFALTP